MQQILQKRYTCTLSVGTCKIFVMHKGMFLQKAAVHPKKYIRFGTLHLAAGVLWNYLPLTGKIKNRPVSSKMLTMLINTSLFLDRYIEKYDKTIELVGNWGKKILENIKKFGE